MHMKFDLVQRGLNDLTYAAERVLQQNKLHITNDDRGPDENEAFSGSLVVWLSSSKKWAGPQKSAAVMAAVPSRLSFDPWVF